MLLIYKIKPNLKKCSRERQLTVVPRQLTLLSVPGTHTQEEPIADGLSGSPALPVTALPLSFFLDASSSGLPPSFGHFLTFPPPGGPGCTALEQTVQALGYHPPSLPGAPVTRPTPPRLIPSQNGTGARDSSVRNPRTRTQCLSRSECIIHDDE